MFGDKNVDSLVQNLSKNLERQAGPKMSFIIKETIKNPDKDFELVVTGTNPTIVVEGFELFKNMVKDKQK